MCAFVILFCENYEYKHENMSPFCHDDVSAMKLKEISRENEQNLVT